ncbi:BUD13 homolog [Nilaparvata lugens]|uniref:BUD13 homolog n=1 Tax=Nilaparvata lugens TaxID=108931 RepID=UPI00193E81EB|nr:BUD13 homolog [Nilaparvata lugens]
MTSQTKVMSQKEYLKKYLSNEKDKKKKKKVKLSSSSVLKRSQIIDDDVDLKTMRVLNDDEIDLYQLDEDAPQIAGIIDERPTEMQAMEYYNDKKRWKVFGDADGDGDLLVKDKYQRISNADSSDSRNQKSQKLSNQGENDDSDLSPPRDSKTGQKFSRDVYKTSGDKPNKSTFDTDLSPERRPKESKSLLHKKSRRKSSDSDQSPPRRKSRFEPTSSKKCSDKSDSDLSPPRHSQKSSNTRKRDSDSDFSPPRLSKSERDTDKTKKGGRDGRDSRFSQGSDVNDKKHKSKHGSNSERENVGSPNSKKSDRRMEKTLDGKRAGLQNASQLRKELTDFKTKEDTAFSKLASDMSGVNAAPVIRDRKTGMIRDLQQEQRVAEEKAAKAAVQTEKYSRWGRGVKQTEDAAERAASAIHEMSKPLARYADDDDLERVLKAQEREGDPMLDYIRRKQSESTSLKEAKPMYQGSFTPNRYGIRPGYRWDGVDRSNGFEKQWFTTQNNRKARDEEAYKWSISDM